MLRFCKDVHKSKVFVTFAHMDSLTQIVLGAACGEIALGRKIGNRALLFGAIGGTIPDLDVIFGNLFFSNSIDQLAFHRGFMHSILFAVISPFLFGWITFKLYDREKGFMHAVLFTVFNPFLSKWLKGKLYNVGKRTGTTNLRDWILLYFLAVFTHPILDSFTPYGTQLFLPFSDYRVAFNNISVADPFYTLPFLVCIIVVMFFKRNTKARINWNRLGLYISSAYMLFTIGNKLYMDTVFEQSFEKSGIEFSRFSTQPTILNNVLWYGIAETKEDYKVAFYSLLDKSAFADSIISLPKNHHLLNMSEPDLKTLDWFSNGYYNLALIDSSKNIRYNDLRYPLLNAKDKNSSVFSFELEKNGTRWENHRYIDESFKNTSFSETFSQFIERIKGI